MSRFLHSVICAVLLSSFTLAAPAPQATTTTSVADAIPTVAYAPDASNAVMWTPDTASDNVEPIRGSLGGTILGPQNIELQQQNPDMLAPPTTDHGTV